MAEKKTWTIHVHRDAEKILQKLDRETFNRIRKSINQLITEPKPVGCKKLGGEEPLSVARGGLENYLCTRKGSVDHSGG